VGFEVLTVMAMVGIKSALLSGRVWLCPEDGSNIFL
jgi:hypothetical protein